MGTKFRFLSYMLVGGLAFGLVGTSCSKKKKKSSAASETAAATETAPITDVDSATVTAADTDLVVTSKLNLIPPKNGAGLYLSGYDDQKTAVWVQEDSFAALEQAESILCFISQTRYEEHVNAGPYLAMIDEAKCKDEKRDEQSAQSYMNMKVLVTREPNKPLLVKGWIVEEQGKSGGKESIHIQLKVAEGSSVKNPLGIFKFIYQMNGETTAVRMGGGTILTYRSTEGDTVNIKFLSSESSPDGDNNYSAHANLDVDADGAITGGRVATQVDTNENKSSYKLAFNADLITKSGTAQSYDWNTQAMGAVADKSACIDRNAVTSNVFRYGLYDAAGARKDLSSGFQIEFETGGKTVRGNVNYNGLWVEGDATLNNGATVNRVEWTSGSKVTTPYKIVKAPGKLYKYTQKTATLADLKGVDMRYSDWSSQDKSTYIVQWNGSAFVKVGKVDMNSNSNETTAASGTVTIGDWGLHLWVDSLSANINIPHGATLSDSYEIKFHAEEMVSGSQAADLTLKCFSRCPKMAATYNTSDFNWAYEAYPENKQEYEVRVNDGALKTYRFDATKKNLYLDTMAYAAPSGEGAWVESGVLVTTAQLGTLSTADISPYDLEGRLESFYRWKSSSQTWGQYYAVAAVSDGVIVQFDKPLQFSYSHSQVNDYDGAADAGFYGKTFRLNYGGFGELWGIPWKKADGEREQPVFSIKAATQMVDDLGVTYTAKPLEVAQTLGKVAADQCAAAGLDAASAPELPTADIIEAIDLGEPPADADAPTRVIGGVTITE